MKVIGFSGSPRRNGSTNALIERILKKVEDNNHETNIYYLNELNINPCQACRYCAENEGCDLDDDMINLYDELEDADFIIIGSPIYFGQISAQTKLFTDRFYSVFNSKTKNFKDKKAILIYTQGNPDPETYTSYVEHDKKFLYEFMDFKIIGTLVASGLHNKKDLLNNEKIMRAADNFGNMINSHNNISITKTDH